MGEEIGQSKKRRKKLSTMKKPENQLKRLMHQVIHIIHMDDIKWGFFFHSKIKTNVL